MGCVRHVGFWLVLTLIVVLGAVTAFEGDE
jgi:hypothetical protein